MDMMHSCRCCLRCAPDKDLTTPYTHLGVTEIYADMLQQCFDIHLVLGDEDSRGICSICVDRLRDASDFKMQVQRSQAALLVTVELEPVVKPEPTDEDNDPMSNVFDEEPIEKLEMVGEDETGRVWDEDPLIKSETRVMSDDSSGEGAGAVLAEPPRSESTSAQQQHEATCSAGLERLRGDEERTSMRRPRKSYTCEHCSNSFGYKSVLRKHIQHTHLPSGHKDFSSSTIQTKLPELEQERNEHSETNFMCTECEYTTFYKKHFKTHLKNHALKKLFKCKQCNYTCQYRSYLLRHQIIHTSERFFMCSDCGFKCNDKSNLRRHLRKHSSDKPLQCNHCDYKCREKIDLQRHQHNKHTKVKPLKCNICEYRCTLKSKLRIHERTHTNEKPFKCSNCDYKSSYKSQLRNHQRIHTGEPFTCSHCNFTSLYKEHLQRHLKAKHSGEKINVATSVLGN